MEGSYLKYDRVMTQFAGLIRLIYVYPTTVLSKGLSSGPDALALVTVGTVMLVLDAFESSI